MVKKVCSTRSTKKIICQLCNNQQQLKKIGTTIWPPKLTSLAPKPTKLWRQSSPKNYFYSPKYFNCQNEVQQRYTTSSAQHAKFQISLFATKKCKKVGVGSGSRRSRDLPVDGVGLGACRGCTFKQI